MPRRRSRKSKRKSYRRSPRLRSRGTRRRYRAASVTTVVEKRLIDNGGAFPRQILQGDAEILGLNELLMNHFFPEGQLTDDMLQHFFQELMRVDEEIQTGLPKPAPHAADSVEAHLGEFPMGVEYIDPEKKTSVQQAARQRLLEKIENNLSTVSTGPPSPSGLPRF